MTECEIIWSKLQLKNRKDLYLASFYMPHRNMNDILKLDESLKKVALGGKAKYIMLAGDFNCPDIDWDSLSVKPNATGQRRAAGID